MNQKQVKIDYTNWRNERGIRAIIPHKIYFGSNEWHPTPQYLLEAWDVEKEAFRTFSLQKIHQWIEEVERVESGN